MLQVFMLTLPPNVRRSNLLNRIITITAEIIRFLITFHWPHQREMNTGRVVQRWTIEGSAPATDALAILLDILLGPTAKAIVMIAAVIYASVFMWASSRISLCSAPCSHHPSLFSCLFCLCQPYSLLPTQKPVCSLYARVNFTCLLVAQI